MLTVTGLPPKNKKYEFKTNSPSRKYNVRDTNEMNFVYGMSFGHGMFEFG